MWRGKYVVVGNSAAALAALDFIRKYDRSEPIFLLNCERGPAYSRVALPYYVSGELSLEKLRIRRPAEYERLGVRLIEEALVTSVDGDAREVTLADGRRIGFEKLLVATGSQCVVPPIRGLDAVDAYYLWTLEDAKRMKTAAERARTAVVIGGGFIGMLAAEALRKLGVRLTIVEMAPQLLPQLLDEAGGSLFLQAVRDTAVSVRLGTAVESVARREGFVDLTLRGGETISADMVVVATGVKPNLSALGNGTLETASGILVDEQLQTNCLGIYAAGDVAEVRDFLEGNSVIHAIWPTAVEQGRVAGANMAGAAMRYPGSLGMNVVELFGVTLAQVGRFREGPADDVWLLGRGGNALYRKIVVDRDGTMVGAMYLGDANGVAEMGVVQAMIRRRARWRELAKQDLSRFTHASAVRLAHGAVEK